MKDRIREEKAKIITNNKIKMSKIAIFLFLIMAINTVSPVFIYGESNPKTPSINSISINKTNIMADEACDVTIDANSNGVGIESVHLYWKLNNGGAQDYLYMSFSAIEDKATIKTKIDARTKQGVWTLESITISDKNHNHKWYTPEETKLLNVKDIKVEQDPRRDTEAPVLHSLKVNKNTVKAGEKLVFDVNTTDNFSGTAGVNLHWTKEGTDGQNENSFSAWLNTNKNVFTKEYTVPSNTPPGKWLLTGYSIYDNDRGYKHGYKSYNPDINYANLDLTIEKSGITDITPPVLKNITMINGTLNVPGVVKFVAEAEDESEIKYIYVKYNNTHYGFYKNEKTGKYENRIDLKKEDKYIPKDFKYLSLQDEHGNVSYYTYKENEMDKSIDKSKIFHLDTNLDINIKNQEIDKTFPVLKDFKWLKNSLTTPGYVELEINGIDTESGIECIKVELLDEDNILTHSGMYLHPDYQNTSNIYKGKLELSRYTRLKNIYIDKIIITDYAGNITRYAVNNKNGELKIDKKSVEIKGDNSKYVFLGTRDADYINKIAALPSGSTAVVDIGTDSIINKRLFDEIKGKDINIVFEKMFGYEYNAQGIQWCINGKDINSETKDIDVAVQLDQAYFNIYGEKAPQMYCGGGDGMSFGMSFYSPIQNKVVDFEVGTPNSTIELTKEEYDIMYDKLSKEIEPKITDFFEKEGYSMIIDHVKNFAREKKLNFADAMFTYPMEKPYCKVEFKPNGKLPCKSFIRVKMDYATRNMYANKDLSLYYYNKETDENEELSDKLELTEDGYYEFYVTHNSEYRIAPKGTFDIIGQEKNTTIKNPPTSDITIVYIAGIGILALGGIIISIKRMHKNI